MYATNTIGADGDGLADGLALGLRLALGLVDALEE